MKFRALLSFRSVTAPLVSALLAACFSMFVVAVSHGAPDDADAPASADAADSGRPALKSGQYKGTWESRDGRSGESILTIRVDGQEFHGHLALWGGRYAGDDVTGKIVGTDDDSIEVEFKTDDGSLKSKGEFDGQTLSGSYRYRYMVGKNRKQEKVDWTLEMSGASP